MVLKRSVVEQPEPEEKMVGRKSSKVVALAAIAAFAVWVPYNLCEGFLPENSMKIYVGDKSATGLTEEQFHAVLDRVEEIYKPIISKMGGKLVVNRKWEDPTVNAYANRGWGGTWNISMFGGLARHSAVTPDGFALVACHEIGHHIGGFPKSRGWATNEGGSDYFATLKCLRLYYGGADKGSVREECNAAHAGGNGGANCERNAQSGLSIAKLFQELRKLPEPPDFSTPDGSVVDRTNNSHPAPQCRLDTYFQGGLCNKSVSEDVASGNPNPGTCTRAAGYVVGIRPTCWYKPPAKEQAPPKVAVIDQLPNMEALGRRISALRLSLDAS